jgi:phenylacetate-CoA ligase
MLIIRGVNVYPSSIEAVLKDIEGVEPRYRIVVYKEGALDQIEIQIEVEESFFADTVRKVQAFQQHVEERMRQELGIRPRVRLVEPKTIPASVDARQRVVNMRTKGSGGLSGTLRERQ